MQKAKRPPRIIVKKTEETETLQQLKQKITHYLVEEKSIQTNTIFERKNKDEIVISVHNKLSVEKTVETLQTQLSQMCR